MASAAAAVGAASADEEAASVTVEDEAASGEDEEVEAAEEEGEGTATMLDHLQKSLVSPHIRRLRACVQGARKADGCSLARPCATPLWPTNFGCDGWMHQTTACCDNQRPQ